MYKKVLFGLLAVASLPPRAQAQAVRVQGLVWGGNVAGGNWYLRDTPSYNGQPCYYIESSRVNWGWGGASSTYGGSVTRVNNRGGDSQTGSGYASSGFTDSLTITAPGVPSGTAGTLNGTINISTAYTPDVYFYPDWSHLAGHLVMSVGTSLSSNDLYYWEAYHWPGGLYQDWYHTIPASPIPPSITYSRSFQFGVPFPIGVYGTINAEAQLASPPEHFELHLESFVSWGGVTSVTGPGGPVSGYSIVSASGTSYTGAASACSCGGAGSPLVDGPHSVRVCPGGQATLTVTPQTSGPLAYQWRKDGSMIAGARSEQLVVPVNGAPDTGQFDCLVTNGCGTTLSAPAHVGLTDADFNCDGDVGTDADIEAFFACLAGNCPGPSCGSTADFNGDGDTGTDADIESFFRVLGGGLC